MENTQQAKKSKLPIIITIVVIIVVGVIIYALLHMNEEKTDDAQIDAHIVPISAKVSGYVKVLHITDNQVVKAGDVLLEIEPVDYQNALNQADATLEMAQSKLDSAGHTLQTTKVSAPSDQASASANVDAAEANWKNAVADLKRLKAVDKEAISQQQLDKAVADEQSAHSAYIAAQAKQRSANTAPATVAAAISSVKELAAAVHQAQAEQAEAAQHLTDTKVIAPIDGRVTKRGVEMGAYITPGQQLFSIVGNDYWVTANYKENQLKHIQPGQQADIEIDAYPGHKLSGKVDSIQAGTGARFSSFPPENATGNFVKIVQRVPVKILVNQNLDPTLAIGPGMSVEPTIYTK